jgi:hypothetical protein
LGAARIIQGMADSVVVGAALAQRPGYGGHAWALLQYALGFRELGFDVTVIDRLDESMLPDPVERRAALDWLGAVMDDAGLGNSYGVLLGNEGSTDGISRPELLARMRQARLFVNVMGFIRDQDLLAAARRRVFVDIDPGFGQLWRELGQADIFEGHDVFVTVGRNLGEATCQVPTCGLEWIRLPHPVVLSHCPPGRGGPSFRSVGSWRGPYAPVEFHGRTYGLRVHQFRRFAALPRLAQARFELALDIDPGDVGDLELLRASGWIVLRPRDVAADPAAYLRFIQGALAEVTVAKDMYVQTGSGWLGDRTICALACGRPALVQDTGLGHLYPIGEGLLTFSTLHDAVAGARDIRRNAGRHAAAARRLAETEFDARLVLGRLLEEAE